MNNEKRLVPKLRFPEFTDAWEQRKLGKITNSYSGGTPSVSIPNYYGGNIPFIRSGEIGSENTELFITEDGLNNSSAKLVSKGDILYALYGATSGEVSRSLINGAINQAILAIKPHENFSSEFITQWLKGKKSHIVSSYLQGGQGNLSAEIVKNLVIFIPQNKEQQKIGTFFTALDCYITIHQRKLENVKKLKKSLLQKMFPKNDQKFPEIRFPEFTDAWEQRKLGELAKFNPKSILPDTFKYVDLESVSGTELLGYKTENKYSAPSRAQRLAQKGDIFYQTVRPYQKNNYLFDFEDKDFVFSTGYAQLRPQINGYFLFSRLQEDNFVRRVLDKCTGTSYPAINGNDLSEISIRVSDNPKEQQKIGTFFTELDRYITIHQRKLENVKKLKKSLLQQMFV
ncbi:hypothetical protein BKK47_02465 [Rodentibacter mrazii]|uniref:Type I restriction modification DNA specificity domain-containing protein n=1 Tax=Rodentibacter mrazii TaxID=1908257 RepID=A0A1V3IIQ6_9PAST|nr:restriction endonuclease subunit S [Rodentibacter mrazii]OOF40990.1 hypothetical protein BKK47_02465 [Rodentibacter mrazii]